MSDRILLYHGLMEDFGFYPNGMKPSQMGMGFEITPEAHKELCSKGRFSKDIGPYDQYKINQSLIVAFPKELEEMILASQGKIESAGAFEQAVAELRELAHALPCTETPGQLELYHSTDLTPEVILSQGFFSPRGYLERFGQFPPEMYGQMSGDGICTTAEMQKESEDSTGPKGRFPHGKHQYKITLDSPRVLTRGEIALSVMDWYIKLRNDFGLPVYQNDSVQSHDIVAPTCNRVQGLASLHSDLGYDVIETEFEHLIKKKHVDAKQVECVGSFQ
jgi:hypothetical protein